MNIKQALKGKMPSNEIEKVHRAFDTVGDIAIITIDPAIKHRKKMIAETLAGLHKHINVVLLKTEDVSGRHRLGRYELLVGDRTETEYRESGCRFKVDPTRAYISPRLAAERERIVRQVRDGENILCMYAGVGPYPIIIAKNRAVSITAVEVNPAAAGYFRQNLLLNKKLKGSVRVVEGDVEKALPSLKEKFDRAVMPAPTEAEKHLGLALSGVKKGGVVNYYSFSAIEDTERLPLELEKRCRKLGRKVKASKPRLCGDTAAYYNRVAVDLKLLD